MRFAFALLLGGLLACSAPRKAVAPPEITPNVTDGSLGVPVTPREDIEKLAGEIREATRKLDMPVVTTGDEPVPAADRIVLPSSDATCQPAQQGTCPDICTLAESICKNAKRICEIAAEMNGDAWANGKCIEGKAACDGARVRCCGCNS
jgi:hypothetical protein